MTGSNIRCSVCETPEQEAERRRDGDARAGSPWRRAPGCSTPAGRCPGPSRRASRTARGCRACSPPRSSAATADPATTRAGAPPDQAARAAMPTSGRQKCADRVCMIIGSSGQAVDRETTARTSPDLSASNVRRRTASTFCISAHLRRDAHLLHRLEVDVRPHHPLGDACVVGRALDHAPAPELRQPPLAEDRLRVVAVRGRRRSCSSDPAPCGRRRSRTCPAAARG